MPPSRLNGHEAREPWPTLRMLLQPGMGLKRWILLFFLGITIIALGLGYFLRQIYEVYVFPDFVYYATLQFLPRYLRGVLFLSLGFGSLGVALWKLNTTVLSALTRGGEENVVATLYQQRYLRRGPKIVAIGGGNGLSTVLRGLKEHTGNLTAIVTVADDGGSTGRLRRELGVLPPGDFRKCIAALADAEPLMTELFQYRFDEGDGLEGHSFGNLFIVAMANITGNFERAIQESSRVLAVRGQILPSTLADVTLGAEYEDAITAEGESNIPQPGRGARIRRVYLTPEDAPAHPEAVKALLEADLIVLGPGSLYTSILPNLLVSGIRQAIQASTATKVYVCNVAEEPGETEGYTVTEHLQAVLHHGGAPIDVVLAQPPIVGTGPAHDPSHWPANVELQWADVVDPTDPYRHDPRKLAARLVQIAERRGRAPRALASVNGRHR
ncbi:MAG TPA: gluconeogenesis factor YvcK family protein [Dehalococcoidia bacterium]|nr:gluconeogenesis factor YvcK family protein [Dehalococcoidia bacterium]